MRARPEAAFADVAEGLAPAGFTRVSRERGTIALIRDDLRAWYEAGGLDDPEEVLRAATGHDEVSPSESRSTRRGGATPERRGETRDADRRDWAPTSRGEDGGGARSAHEGGAAGTSAEGDLRRSGSVRESGRGVTARIPSPLGARLVLRKYRRGGALGDILPDAFFGVGRMTAELAALERARAHGVPTARPAGLILDRAGPLWRGYLLTEEVAGARTLDRALGALAPGSSEARELAARAVATVRAMHDAGIVHADLNARNLLVRDGEVLLIDLDGALLPREVTPDARFANLSRLDRSYCKLFGDTGPLSSADRRALMAAYCRGDSALQTHFESRIDAHMRSVRWHSLLWRR